MQKRAQSEIIITVLIVLVALAAVAVIATFIINQVRSNVESAEAKGKVMSLDISITSALANNNFIVLKKNSNNVGVNITNISITLNGNYVSSVIDLSRDWNVFETKNVSLPNSLQVGDNIEVYAVFSNVSKIPPILVAKMKVNAVNQTGVVSKKLANGIVCTSPSQCISGYCGYDGINRICTNGVTGVDRCNTGPSLGTRIPPSEQCVSGYCDDYSTICSNGNTDTSGCYVAGNYYLATDQCRSGYCNGLYTNLKCSMGTASNGCHSSEPSVYQCQMGLYCSINNRCT